MLRLMGRRAGRRDISPPREPVCGLRYAHQIEQGQDAETLKVEQLFNRDRGMGNRLELTDTLDHVGRASTERIGRKLITAEIGRYHDVVGRRTAAADKAEQRLL